MAYSTSNRPKQVLQFGASGLDGSLWIYSSADGVDTFTAAGYITNARDLDMRRGDPIIIRCNTNARTWFGCVSSINATTGAATLDAGLQLLVGDLAPSELPS